MVTSLRVKFFSITAIACIVILLLFASNTHLKIQQTLENTLLKTEISNTTKISKNTVINESKNTVVYESKNTVIFESKNTVINVAFVACTTSRLLEMRNMLKSLLLFNKADLKLFVFTDEANIPKLGKMLNEWRKVKKFSYEILLVRFPQGSEDWKSMFKPCSTQRLFFPDILQEVDALLYVDVDTIFLAPVEEIWEVFTKMSDQQVAAVAYESIPYTGWYVRRKKIPYYGNAGLNSGVMLMNLTRMRQFGWLDHVFVTYEKWNGHIDIADQDIINIIFHDFPERLYSLPCRQNFRHDFYMKDKMTCQNALDDGFGIVHGSIMWFSRPGFFKAVFDGFNGFELGDDVKKLYDNMKRSLSLSENIEFPDSMGARVLQQIKSLEDL